MDQHDAPGAMEHSQGESALSASHLIMVQLHGIDGAAAKFVVLRIRPKNGAQKHTRTRTSRMGHATTRKLRIHRQEIKFSTRAPISFVTGEHEGAGGSVLFEHPRCCNNSAVSCLILAVLFAITQTPSAVPLGQPIAHLAPAIASQGMPTIIRLQPLPLHPLSILSQPIQIRTIRTGGLLAKGQRGVRK